MKKITFVLLLALSFTFTSTYAQDLNFRMGLGLDLDMGVKINDNVPSNHTLNFQNSALASADAFTKLSLNGFNATPCFKISWATFGRSSRQGFNTDGDSIPEGTYISEEHDRAFIETLDREEYLLSTSDVHTTIICAGLFLTKDFLCSKTGCFEIGTGFFYTWKTVYYKQYMGYDIYEYFGSTGSHTSQYQTDEYIYDQTVRDKKPTNIQQIASDNFHIPAILQYNFYTGKYVSLSPAFIAYIGTDTYYSVRFSMAFGRNN